MGDRYNRFNPQNIRHKNMFLPMLCSKPAIKDGRPPRCDRDRSESFSGDPLSPRIGCMGQVKRNNRVAGLPISHRILITTKNAVLNNKNGNNPNVGYFKLKKFFSSKNLLSSPSGAGTGTGTTRSTAVAAAASISTAGVSGCGSRRRAAPNCAISGKKGVCENGNGDSFSVVDLDPPLPVVRRVQKAGEEGKYLGFIPNCFFIGCDISAQLIKICNERGHEVLVADAVNLPYRTGFGDAAISIAVLHHLSTENRRKKAIEELLRVVKKGGLVLITVWAVEQEDKSLLTKWMPLSEKYVDEWVGPGSPRVRSPTSLALESIPEMNENNSGIYLKDSKENFTGSMPENKPLPSQSGNDLANCNDENLLKTQQEYFVPWHLPYHRAEVSGTSASALASGLAKKDDKKAAVVYNRYYHVFSEGELERLVSGMDNAVVVDRFYDKSNWCIVLEKTV